MADTGQCFATEAVRANRSQIFEGFEFRGRESFGENRQIVFLFERSTAYSPPRYSAITNIDATAIVCDL